MNELKNLQCVGLTTLGAALKHALDVLNINRMQTGIDTYGQGRCPFYLEPSIIIVITDGGKYTTNSGMHGDVSAIKFCEQSAPCAVHRTRETKRASSFRIKTNFDFFCSSHCRCIHRYLVPS